MSAPCIEPGFPLAWPAGRPRTAPARRKPALFRDAGRPLTLTTARKRLIDQVKLVTAYGKQWRVTDQVLSTNIHFTLAGTRNQNLSRRDPEDPGVAFYFALDGRAHVLACDRWDTVYGNIGAIAAHIEALRGQERWGVADLAQAFAGHVALPAPDPWWRVLGVERDASIEVIGRAWRELARSAHPDVGGDRGQWDRVAAAYDAAKRERS